MLRIRLRVPVSPLIKIRLVRASAIILTREPVTSFEAPVELIDSSSPTISSAWLFCRVMASTSFCPVPSRLRIMVSSCAMFAARSETISAFVPGTAARLAN